MRKILIVNADDLGYSVERDKGILECYKSGAVTSASLMVNGQSAEFAAQLAKQANFVLGLHFNITEGRPLCTPSEVSSLLNGNKTFISKDELTQATKQGLIDFEQVRLELERQIQKFEELTGYTPVHVDGHQHCHIVPGLSQVFAESLKKKGIKVTRLPYEELTPTHPWPTAEFGGFMREVVEMAQLAREVYRKEGLWFSDGYFGLETMGTDFNSPMTAPILKKGLGAVFTKLQSSKLDKSSVSCELMTHPGYRTQEQGGCGEGPDSFSQSPDREVEMAVLKSAEMREFYVQEDVTLRRFVDCVE